MTHTIRLGRLLAALLLSLWFAPLALARGGELEQALSQLTRAEANLELVNGSIGHLTAPPKGSAGKLARMRLDQALTDLDPAAGLIAGLPDGPGVPEAKARVAKDRALYTKLDGILKGTPPAPQPEPAPAPTPEPAPTPKPSPAPQPTPAPQPPTPPAPGETPPAPAEKTVKLGYPHADNLKSAIFNLNRVEADLTALTTLRNEIVAVADPLKVDHRQTHQGLEKLTETRRQAGFVATGLAKIPANGEGVAEAKARLAAAVASLDQIEGQLTPVHQGLLAVMDPARYPDFAADLARLEALDTAYQGAEVQFRELRARAAENLIQITAAEAEAARIAAVYLHPIRQGTELGSRIAGAHRGLLAELARFQEVAERERTGLPASIRKDLAEADQYAREAVEAEQPLWFTGGIPQRMEWAADKLALIEVLDAAQGAVLRREYEAQAESNAQRAASLSDLIIRSNELPPDRYTGDDREAAIAVAVDAWKVQQKDFELLAVRIPSEAWSRETKWTYSNGTWYFSDRSTLQVRLLVADPSNPELCIDRAINVKQDHQKGDSMIGVPLRSAEEALPPNDYLLRSKIR